MSCPSGKDIEKHILEHAILGVGTGGGGGSGDITIINGYATYVDPVRGKTLSTSRATVTATKSGRTASLLGGDGNYLAIGQVVTSQTGWRCPRAATITLISYENSQTGTFTVHLRKNSSETNLASYSVVSGTGGQNTSVNINLSAGDLLQVYIEGLARDPIVSMEIAWRF